VISSPLASGVPCLSLPPTSTGLRAERVLLLVALFLAPAASALAQAPEGLAQDALDLRGRTGLVVGSGARAYGMGGAFLARADDATAASWNPAGLSYLRQPEVTVVGVRSSFDSRESGSRVPPEGADPTPIDERDHSRGYSPDFLAATRPLSLGSISGAAQISFQRVFAFGARRTIGPDVPRTIRVEGGFDVLAVGTGLRVSRQVRLGLTINRWFNGYTQRLDREGQRPSDQFAEFRLSGWNTNWGVLWSPWESLNLGLVAKTPFRGDLRLRRWRTDVILMPSGRTVTTANAHERKDVRLDFPAAVGVGASWRPRSQLTISADYTRTLWSDSRIRNFFTLPRTPVGEDPPPATSYYSVPYPTLTDEGQQDTEQLRAGLEYVILGDRFKFPLRVGYFSDRQNLRDKAGAAPRFNGFTLGAGVAVGPILLDAAFLRESGDYVEQVGSDVSLKAKKVLVSIIYRSGASR